MKAEINNENKKKFFAQYWEQAVCFEPFIEQNVDVNEHMPWKDRVIYKKYLNLKPLSSISDEDVLSLMELMSYRPSKLDYILTFDSRHDLAVNIQYKGNNNDFFETVTSWGVDFLRSRGYALPWMGLSVEEMVAAGWIKLV